MLRYSRWTTVRNYDSNPDSQTGHRIHFYLDPSTKSIVMLGNYFKMAFRNLKNDVFIICDLYIDYDRVSVCKSSPDESDRKPEK
jgi:hypothetical protein